MTKVIFLDIDGVLCTWRSHYVYGMEGKGMRAWDGLACDALRKACSMGVQLVISSTWRIPKNENHLMEGLMKHGLMEFVRQPNWKTPDLYPLDEVSRRSTEVDQYLKDNPDITDYRILDDIAQFADNHGKHFIHTDPDEGMTSANIKQLFNWCRALKS